VAFYGDGPCPPEAAAIDPIIFGAVPALTPEDGEPAAFFELTRWDW
jgi:hypothetical protein